MSIPLKRVQLIMLLLRRMYFFLIVRAHLYCYNTGRTRPKCFLYKRFHIPLHQSSETRPARNLRNWALLQDSNSPSVSNGSADNSGGYFSRFNLNGFFFRNFLTKPLNVSLNKSVHNQKNGERERKNKNLPFTSISGNLKEQVLKQEHMRWGGCKR